MQKKTEFFFLESVFDLNGRLGTREQVGQLGHLAVACELSVGVIAMSSVTRRLLILGALHCIAVQGSCGKWVFRKSRLANLGP